METDYENGPSRTAATDANVHSRPNFGMSQHMPDVHQGATKQAEQNTRELNRDRVEQAKTGHDAAEYQAAADTAAVRPEFKAAGQEVTSTQARPNFSQEALGVVVPDPTERPELKHVPQTIEAEQAQEQAVGRAIQRESYGLDL